MCETPLPTLVQLALGTMTFNGSWKVDRNDNYEKFMEQMGEWLCARWRLQTGESDAGASFGVIRFQPNFTERPAILVHYSAFCLFLCRCVGINMVKRKLAAHDSLKITIQQDGNNFHVEENSKFRNLELEFTLGVTFDYSLADGTELSVSKRGLKTYWHHTWVTLLVTVWCCQGVEPTTFVVISWGIVTCRAAGVMEHGGRGAEGGVHQEGQRKTTDNHQNCCRWRTHPGECNSQK